MESRQSDRVREKEGMRRSATYPKGGHYRDVESKGAGANSAAVYVPPRHRGPKGAEGEVRQVLVAGLRLDARPAWVYTGEHRDRYGEVANYGEPRTRTHPRPVHPGRHRGSVPGPGGRPARSGPRPVTLPVADPTDEPEGSAFGV